MSLNKEVMEPEQIHNWRSSLIFGIFVRRLQTASHFYYINVSQCSWFVFSNFDVTGLNELFVEQAAAARWLEGIHY